MQKMIPNKSNATCAQPGPAANTSTAPVSVVIPTYNGADYLKRTLQSVEQQTAWPLEIIVVDDHSTDETVAIAEEFSQSTSLKLKVLHTEQNSGSPARPMNIGVQAASGPLIAVLDQDDIWLPGKLQQQSKVLMQDKTLSFACSLFGYIRPAGSDTTNAARTIKRLKPALTALPDHYTCPGPTAFDLLVKWENFIGGFPGFLFRRQDWQERGGFDESLKVAADFDFLFYLCSRGSMAVLPEVHYLRREHDNNVTHREAPRLLDVITILLRHITPAAFSDRYEYRQTLGWKILRLSEFLAYSGHLLQAAAMLRSFYRVRRSRWDWLNMPAAYGHLPLTRPLGPLLHFQQLRKVDREEAEAAVTRVKSLLNQSSLFAQR